ncbi:hypothetical protein F5890DRAFT_665604 [Lentinula detonsa]|uniref:Uncharacterized protein n=1 Tax=Lentinula detonsa TaxID=2804962 RepID=A0AA38PRS2_9AGAR|nr:hypothetical protein F5890DRAFT_665604 [Lentinula detonsa]
MRKCTPLEVMLGSSALVLFLLSQSMCFAQKIGRTIYIIGSYVKKSEWFWKKWSDAAESAAIQAIYYKQIALLLIDGSNKLVYFINTHYSDCCCILP